MNKNALPRRLLASFIQSDGPWEVHQKGKARLILRREGIVSPLFSPLWFLGGLFLLYIGWVVSLGVEHGWRGIAILLVPAAAVLWMAINRGASDFRPERVEFNNSECALKVIESNGKTKTTRRWAYADIAQLCLSMPPAARQTRVTTAVIIRHKDPGLSTVRVEGLEEMASVYRVIDELLPATIERVAES